MLVLLVSLCFFSGYIRFSDRITWKNYFARVNNDTNRVVSRKRPDIRCYKKNHARKSNFIRKEEEEEV